MIFYAYAYVKLSTDTKSLVHIWSSNNNIINANWNILVVYCEPVTVEYILELDVYSEQWILSLTPSCTAARVDGSVPDPRHTHVSNHREGQRPPVPPGAVHRLQSDCKYGPRPAAGPDFDLYASDQINDCVKRNVVGFFLDFWSCSERKIRVICLIGFAQWYCRTLSRVMFVLCRVKLCLNSPKIRLITAQTTAASRTWLTVNIWPLCSV